MRPLVLALTIILAASFSFVATPASAIVARITPKDAPLFTCTPNGFTLGVEENGLHLHGQISVPTPGYTADITEEEPGPDGSIHATLHLKAPDGNVVQVISSVDVDHLFAAEGDRVTVSIDKNFTWGDATIECKVAEAK